ncbi:MAG: glycosyltransferase WbuB [Acidimicrobiales bacterium]|nr:MAG: glycosyltransferase WbuB [Acidimicrobiales bacterium]
MKILVVVPHFPPDLAPTGTVVGRIVDELAGMGHRLHVVTSLPWYRLHDVEEPWRGRPVRVERTGWGRVTRVWPFPTSKEDLRRRAASYAAFTAVVTLAALPPRPSADVVFAMSPPLTLGLSGIVAAAWHRAPLVFNVQDVFPDVAVELGVIGEGRVLRAARKLELMVYRRAAAVTVLSDDIAENVSAKLSAAGVDPVGKVEVIPNFVDVEAIRPGSRENSYRREFGLGDRTVVMYAGNVGFSQSLHLMLEAARRMRDRSDVVFVVNGAGAALEQLKAEARDLPNLLFVGYQPADRLAEVLAAADVQVVPLKKGLARSSVPSKLYTILAAGRPVLASVDEGTEVARIVRSSGAGMWVPPDDPHAFVDTLRQLIDSPEQRAEMGMRGRAFVERWVSPRGVAERYDQLFRRLAGP